MLFTELILTFLVALVLSGIVWKVAKWGRPGRDFHWMTAALFLAVVWLATWSIGVWLTPIGPRLFGTPILLFVLVALAFSLLVGYTTPPERRLPPRGATSAVPASGTRMAAGAFVTFFGILLLVFLLAIIARYAWT
jgi:hypothetical protein